VLPLPRLSCMQPRPSHSSTYMPSASVRGGSSEAVELVSGPGGVPTVAGSSIIRRLSPTAPASVPLVAVDPPRIRLSRQGRRVLMRSVAFAGTKLVLEFQHCRHAARSDCRSSCRDTHQIVAGTVTRLAWQLTWIAAAAVG